MRKIVIGAAGGFFLLATAALAQAATTTGYSFLISGNANVPTVQLTNTSTNADITGFSMTIGNTAYNFDAAYHEVLGSVGSFTRISPDTNDGGGVRSDVAAYSFTGFNPGEMFQFQVDVDRDSSNTSEQYYNVLFNNGTAPNSLLVVSFSNNMTLRGILPDYSAGPHAFSQSTAVPLPGALVLLGSGLAGLIGVRRKIVS